MPGSLNRASLICTNNMIQTMAGHDLPGVLFLCVHNAGRSQMAAGWMGQLAGDRVRVMSAGSEPSTEVNAAAVEAMAEVGIDLRTKRPQRWSEEMISSVDVVVTMGCGDTCPFVPGVRYTDWDVADPSGLSVDAIRPIRDDIKMRVVSLLDELGISSKNSDPNGPS